MIEAKATLARHTDGWQRRPPGAGWPMSITSPVVSLKGMSKRFPGVLACDGVDLDVYPGEIQGLLGENGAGKTTLMKVLYGLYQPDAGEILIDGRRSAIRSPKDAIRRGIGMVFQHFTLI